MTSLAFHCHNIDHVERLIVANGLRRGEFYNLPQDDIPRLKRQLRSLGLSASVHTPLVSTPWYPAPPTWTFLCDLDKEKRELNLKLVRQTLEHAIDLGADYVVAHFPAPPSTTVDGMDYAALRDIAWDSVDRLARFSEQHGVPIHVEGFGPSPFLNAEFLVHVLKSYPCLRYCFDTGHLHVAAKRDGFDLHYLAARLAPYVGSIHLWNARDMSDYLAYRHIPVHPSQTPPEGWADIPRLLGLLLRQSDCCNLVFESGQRYPQELGGHDYREGVEWVKELVTTSS